ncbi:peroxiredoxin family protein [Nodosilinea sp. E11]|uniref:peroxiredoxin family protein n=1 Tax=Nodosilinea sp. E11 TaxID=3037479 RepID=UPI0029346D47|nr:peroxiredoxin family protein [Nodosilinea sp. E11]WOD41938.1 peroxiredoxin family protein [Nodosilinea sp. E11]
MTLTSPPLPPAPYWRYWVPRPPRFALPLGQIPPDFALWDVTHQRTVRLANWRGKQPVVLIFGRILAELAYSPQRYLDLVAINQAYPQFRNAGAEVLVITATVRRQGQAVVDDLKLTLPLLSNETGATFRAYHTGQALGAPLPAQFVIDAQGRLRYSHLCSLLHPNASPERLLTVLETL